MAITQIMSGARLCRRFVGIVESCGPDSVGVQISDCRAWGRAPPISSTRVGRGFAAGPCSWGGERSERANLLRCGVVPGSVPGPGPGQQDVRFLFRPPRRPPAARRLRSGPLSWGGMKYLVALPAVYHSRPGQTSGHLVKGRHEGTARPRPGRSGRTLTQCPAIPDLTTCPEVGAAVKLALQAGTADRCGGRTCPPSGRRTDAGRERDKGGHAAAVPPRTSAAAMPRRAAAHRPAGRTKRRGSSTSAAGRGRMPPRARGSPEGERAGRPPSVASAGQ